MNQLLTAPQELKASVEKEKEQAERKARESEALAKRANKDHEEAKKTIEKLEKLVTFFCLLLLLNYPLECQIQGRGSDSQGGKAYGKIVTLNGCRET
jgi:hypothetical protein